MIFQTIALTAMMLAPSTDSSWNPSTYHKFGLTHPMPRIPGTVRIATYNLLNFFDEEINHSPELGGSDKVESWELSDIQDSSGKQVPHTSSARREELAKVIKAIDADILLLQEIESKAVLEDFNTNELAELGYDYVASEDVGYYRGVEQSILSRFPISDIQIWPNANLDNIKPDGIGWSDVDANLTFQRSPLCATVTISQNQKVNDTLDLREDYKITFFVVHHKAGNNAGHREREGLQIVEYIADFEKKNPDINIIVGGDFNAQSHYKSVRSTYLASGMHDSMKQRASNIKYDADAPLWKTHVSDRAIDFLLFNNNAYDELVLNSGFVLGTSSESYDWRKNIPPAGISSDHFPVVLDIVPTEEAGDSVTAPIWPNDIVKESLGFYAKEQTPQTKPKAKPTPKDPNFVATGSLLISGIFDGPLSGGKPKLIELLALQDIPDLSMYSLGRFVNGSDTAKNIFALDQISLSNGDSIVVTTDIDPFEEYFGFMPTYIFKSGVANNNGDDAVGLFEQGELIDLYGVKGEDGSNTNWEYTDGWAHRNANNSPTVDFAISDWTISGKDANDKLSTNEESDNPYPINAKGSD
ncbi:MAG: hypothetical protein HOC27_06175 [Phycisphaerae bacterium]|nr:hypothetical protein [Phycisphaerae bacterium]